MRGDTVDGSFEWVRPPAVAHLACQRPRQVRIDDWIVQISCWTSATGYIVADAVRIERR
jgi:hypothetical protein